MSFEIDYAGAMQSFDKMMEFLKQQLIYADNEAAKVIAGTIATAGKNRFTRSSQKRITERLRIGVRTEEFYRLLEQIINTFPKAWPDDKKSLEYTLRRIRFLYYDKRIPKRRYAGIAELIYNKKDPKLLEKALRWAVKYNRSMGNKDPNLFWVAAPPGKGMGEASKLLRNLFHAVVEQERFTEGDNNVVQVGMAPSKGGKLMKKPADIFMAHETGGTLKKGGRTVHYPERPVLGPVMESVFKSKKIKEALSDSYDRRLRFLEKD